MLTAAAPSPSLTTTLRTMPEAELTNLLRRRSDLAVPQPAGFDALAGRARTALSVSRALDLLDEHTLRVFDGMRVVAERDDGGPVCSTGELYTVAAELDDVDAALLRLRELAVVWGPNTQLRFPDTAAEAAGPYPAGLGRPAAELGPDAAALASDPAALRRAVLAAPQQARTVLDRLATGPPVGTVTDAYADSDADTPVRWLIAHHLLAPIAEDAVELPREVGVLLRRDDGPLGPLRAQPEPKRPATTDPAGVDAAGAAQICEVVRLTTMVLDAMAQQPVAALKAGGIGMQSLHRLARAVDLSDHDAAVLLEAGYAAGLLGREPTTGAWLPSGAFDGWQAASLSTRWARLAHAWLRSDRDARLVGTHPGQSKPTTPLSGALASRSAPRHRREALTVLAEQPAGAPAAAGTVVDICAWRHPRRRADTAVHEALAQAEFLGVIAAEALTGYGRLLLDHPPAPSDPLGVEVAGADPLLAALDAVLPAPVEHLVVQSDLTVVAPGPPSPLLAAELALLTQRESAAVFRVTEASLRAALDAGHSADDLHQIFARRSEGPVPQALTYLIDDMARKHGGLRAGAAGAYVRSEDESLVAQALADRRLASAHLRRLAPTVLTSPTPLPLLLAALREAGYAPIAEDALGGAVIDHSTGARAPRSEHPPAAQDPTPRVDGAPLAALVEQLRQSDARTPAPESADVDVAAVLLDAVPDRAPVWVEYVDSHGEAVRKLLRPVSVASGYLRAEDKRTDMLHTIALHRIRSAAPATV